MSHLSKESRITFNALLIVPLIWIALNHFGFLEFLEYKTVDLRFKVRGNLSHQDGGLGDETVLVEGNKTIPRVPKVIYVNFDADTLSMDEVGERPWNRGFFRDVGEILLEDGNARVVAYDFIFSPKSTSSMVPEKNVYASDSAITQLVSKFPGQVVLASAFTNVQTPFLKNEYVDFLSKPPYLSEGFDASKMVPRYPEGPTYPIFSYQDERYVGINGPITIAPNSVDGMQRQEDMMREEMERQAEMDRERNEMMRQQMEEQERMDRERIEQQMELDEERMRMDRERMEQQMEQDRERMEMERQMMEEQEEFERERMEQQREMMGRMEGSGGRDDFFEPDERCFVEDAEEGRGLFGNLEIGAEVDCELGDGLRERFEDPTSLAMLGLVVTVGATMLQMLRGN